MAELAIKLTASESPSSSLPIAFELEKVNQFKIMLEFDRSTKNSFQRKQLPRPGSQQATACSPLSDIQFKSRSFSEESNTILPASVRYVNSDTVSTAGNDLSWMK